jgi:hypothetical protein
MSAARRLSRVLMLASWLACSRSSRSLSAVSTASVKVSPVVVANSLASLSASSGHTEQGFDLAAELVKGRRARACLVHVEN